MGAMAQTPKGFVSIEVDADFFNFAGQKVLSLKNSLKADISTLSKGIYQV